MRLALVSLLAFAAPVLAQDHVAPTEAKTPAEEQKTFKLPPGFEAQLVASEPDIGKPIQMAFDAKGRLWVTTSRHYPFAAEGKASDRLFVLSDFGPDGKARKVTTFADDLNIPIGVLPLPDCNSCLVSHVGSILKLTDTDGDGKADRRETLLTGFGTRDTHGMMNSFLLLPDGWVYACHGYLNESVVKGTDGSTIRMQSGNTFRFRPDGTKLEHWTFGQVNPFGLTIDPYFNLYTADCHSKPITQLIRDAYYDSFGKPHDGLGYGPHVTQHDHASTALCGLAWYDADHFPKEWNGCMFLGNVTGNRVNADRIEWHGSTPVAKELPDFLVSSDPWFRPTDVKLGPDGALYVADFYNRIIGHYEVPLTHPGRDKDRGRVWRIVWKGEGSKPPAMPFKDLTKDESRNVLKYLDSPNIAARMLATLELIRRGPSVIKQLPLPKWKPDTRNDRAGGHFAWLLFQAGVREGGDEDRDLALKLVKTNNRPLLIQLEWARCEQDRISGPLATTKYMKNSGTHALSFAMSTWDHLAYQGARAEVQVMAKHPHRDNVKPLVELIQKCPPDDTHLKHAARIALRNTLRDTGAWPEEPDALTAPIIADVAAGVPNKRAATYLLNFLRHPGSGNDPRFYERIGRYGDDQQASEAIELLGRKTVDIGLALKGLRELARGLQARGAGLPDGRSAAVLRLCRTGLGDVDPEAVQAAIDVATALKLAPLFDPLTELAARKNRGESSRAAALAAVMAIDPAKATPLLARALADESAVVRDRSAQALAGANRREAREALVAALTAAPAKEASTLATALASNPAGAAALLDAIRAGKASPRLLQERGVSARLLAIDRGRLKPRIDELTRGLPSADAKLDALIRSRSASFKRAQGDPVAGKAVFTKHCAVCHQIGGEGAKVGPNLDGIGVRGPDRLLEDILDPNRNIDLAFRATQLDLLDGRTLTGQLLREEGQVLVLADAAGKEVRVNEKEIDRKATSTLSIMPANMDPAIPEADLYHLLAYLLTQTAKK